MRIVLVHVTTGSGNDVFFNYLERALRMACPNPIERVDLPKACELLPWLIPSFLRRREVGPGDLIICNLDNQSRISKDWPHSIAIAHHNPSNPDLLQALSGARKLYYQAWLSREFRRGLGSSRMIVAVSNTTMGELKRHPEFSPTALHQVIHNGIDTEFFCPSPNLQPSNKRPFRLLFVGNPSPRKGFDLLPATMRILGPDYSLRVTSGLRSSNARHPLPPNIQLLGRLSITELLSEYRQCNALLFPSRLEGFGYSAVEAMACGKPVVGVNCSTMPEIISPSQRDLLAAAHCPDLLAEKVRIACNRPTHATSLRNWVLQNFTLEKMGLAYAQVIRGIESSRSG